MKRIFDLVVASVLLIVLAVPMLIIALLVRFSTASSALYWSDRVGKDMVIFSMPKFRSMYEGAPEVATDQLENPEFYVTKLGGLLRRTSLDELPQLFSILKGDMSFVGPRPALFNQHKLIAMREQKGVNHLVPGLTGLAQINGRDELGDAEKTEWDVEYLRRRSVKMDLAIIWRTFCRAFSGGNISH